MLTRQKNEAISAFTKTINSMAMEVLALIITLQRLKLQNQTDANLSVNRKVVADLCTGTKLNPCRSSPFVKLHLPFPLKDQLHVHLKSTL